MNINIYNLKKISIYLLLFFTAMNFKANFFYLTCLSFGVLFLVQGELLINLTAFLYLILGIIMILYESSKSVFSIIWSFSFVFMYLIGYNMICSRKYRKRQELQKLVGNVEKDIFNLIAVIAGGTFIHFILNFIVNQGNTFTRNTIDIWTGEIMAATGQVAIASIMLGVAVSMIFVPLKRGYRVLGIFCLLLMLAYNLILACRTMIAIVLCLGFICIIYKWKITTKMQEKLKFTIGLMLLLFVVLITYEMNIYGVQDYILESNLLERLDFSYDTNITNGSRVNSKIAYITHALEHPFGGLHLRNKYGYAHDLLLDGYDQYGMIGFFLLLIILIIGVKEIIKFVKYTDYDDKMKLAVICVYVSILLEFCVEPILAGMSWLYACFCLINGCVTGMNVCYYRRRKLMNESITD